MKPYLIGLTGSIASGKSTALAAFATCGAAVLSADELVRELYQNPAVQKKLIRLFGSCNPTEIAKQVFNKQTARKKLEDLLHPLVWKLAQQKLVALKEPICIFEVPLLFEAGWQKKMDLTVTVAADEKNLRARLQARGLSGTHYKKRLQTQLAQAEKIRQSDLVIFNQGSKKQLSQKVSRLYRALTTIYGLN